MWEKVKSGVVQADETLIKTVLRTKYQNKQSCRLAARLAAGATVADVLDGNDQKSKGGLAGNAKNLLDFFGDIALMNCIGMTPLQICMFYVCMCVILVVVYKQIRSAIPDDMFANCEVCKTERGKRVCRKGTESECARMSFIFEFIISTVLGILVTVLIRKVFVFLLKVQIYKLSALFLETVVREIA